ncbi:MAG: caspase family protein [Bacteroidota bacterium]|nr:caspase family protein [Bacteroidota bacterium]
MRFHLFLPFAVLFFSSTFAQKKHALIIAIDKFEHSGWQSLHSNIDASVIRTALTRRGFDNQDITTIQNEKATYKGIKEGLNSFINNGTIKAGDIVAIHISSHGLQLEDDNGDEVADGLDECIVSYDAVYDKDPKNYKKIQGNYFRDDEFGAFIQQLRTKLEKDGDVLVFIDACHSGTGTKGTAPVRGGKEKLVSDTFDAQKWGQEDTAGLFRETSSTKGDKNSLATYIVISGARSDEVNQETDDNDFGLMGSLSNAIMKVFEQLDPAITYRSFFAKIQSIMNGTAPGQHPVLEGDGIDRQVFGGRFLAQQRFFEISSIEGKEIKLKSGVLCGLDERAKIVIAPSGTTDLSTVKPLASGTVTASTNFSATVLLDKALKIEPNLGWAFITEPVYKTEPVILQIDPGYSDAENNAIKDAFKELPLIRFDGKPELVLNKGQKYDSLKIMSNGFLFDTISSSTGSRLTEKIQRYSQYKLLRDLEIIDTTAHVQVKMVPYNKGKADTTKIDTKMVRGIYEYRVGDTMVLWVKNTGKLPVYVNVLDLQPDGIINAILPRSGSVKPEDLRIDAGVSKLLDPAHGYNFFNIIGPPCGDEIFKIFVSKEMINMEIIANSQGTKGSFKVLEKLVKNSYSVAAKGPKNENVSSTDGSIFNLLFRIVPAKKTK